jgi:uncharacterized protein (DUF2062 family)
MARAPRRRSFVSRLGVRVRRLVRRAKNERASPREVGEAVFLGVFAGCSPAVGVHGPIALALATVLRRNRLYAFLGSRVSNIVILPFIVLAEVQASHVLRTGHWAALTRARVLDEAPSLLLDWIVGSILVGAVMGFVVGWLAYMWAKWRAARRRKVQADDRTLPGDEGALPPLGTNV